MKYWQCLTTNQEMNDFCDSTSTSASSSSSSSSYGNLNATPCRWKAVHEEGKSPGDLLKNLFSSGLLLPDVVPKELEDEFRDWQVWWIVFILANVVFYCPQFSLFSKYPFAGTFRVSFCEWQKYTNSRQT